MSFNNKPLLHLPDLLRSFYLMTYASATGVIGVIAQRHGDIPHPVFYVIKNMTAEIRYSSLRGEL